MSLISLITNGVLSKTGRTHSELQCCYNSPQLLCLAAEPKRPGWQPSLSPWHSTPHHQVHVSSPISTLKAKPIFSRKLSSSKNADWLLIDYRLLSYYCSIILIWYCAIKLFYVLLIHLRIHVSLKNEILRFIYIYSIYIENVRWWPLTSHGWAEDGSYQHIGHDSGEDRCW